MPKGGSTIYLAPANESAVTIKATYVSPAAQSDLNGYGKTFYYSAPAESLRIGMRVSIEANSNTSSVSSGGVIPNQAVVWYGGKPWAYFKQGKNKQGKINLYANPLAQSQKLQLVGLIKGWIQIAKSSSMAPSYCCPKNLNIKLKTRTKTNCYDVGHRSFLHSVLWRHNWLSDSGGGLWHLQPLAQ